MYRWTGLSVHPPVDEHLSFQFWDVCREHPVNPRLQVLGGHTLLLVHVGKCWGRAGWNGEGRAQLSKKLLNRSCSGRSIVRLSSVGETQFLHSLANTLYTHSF